MTQASCPWKPEESARARAFLKELVPHQGRILAYILTWVPDRVDAEDLLQETLFEMWRQFDRYQPGTQFVSWAVTIAKFKILRHRERHARDRLQFSSEFLDSLEGDRESVLDAMPDYVDALRRCRAKLGPRDSELLRLRYEEGQTYDRIAQAWGRSLQAIHQRLAKVQAALLRCVRLTLRRERVL